MTPGTGLENESFTVADSALVKAVLIVADCDEPAVAVTDAAAPGELVSKKFTVGRFVAVAVTVYCPPAVVFAVNAADATPDAFVVTGIVVTLPVNLPDAPVPGAVNVTLTPDTGLFPASSTVTASGVNAVFTVAVCGVVLVFAVIWEGTWVMCVGSL